MVTAGGGLMCNWAAMGLFITIHDRGVYFYDFGYIPVALGSRLKSVTGCRFSVFGVLLLYVYSRDRRQCSFDSVIPHGYNFSLFELLGITIQRFPMKQFWVSSTLSVPSTRW